MSSTALRKARYEDLFDLPENVVGEIVNGEVHVSPRPASPHARVSSVLGSDIGGPFDRGRGGPGGWWILFEPELHLGPDVLVPDLAGWRKERMPQLLNTPYFELPPDWICEVLSPSTARLDRLKKLPIYARVGVRWAWLVDPLARTLEVLEQREGLWTILSVHADDEELRAPPFDAVPLELGALWLPEAPA